MEEQWKEIDGFPGYEVSNFGNVRSYWSVGRSARIQGISRPRKTHKTRDGYVMVGLWRDGKQATCKVHRLVLTAFVGQCPEGLEACHNNGDPSDNRLINLRWGSKKENQTDRIKHGTSQHGERHQSRKLTQEQVDEIRRHVSAPKETCVRLAEKFSISQSQVRKIIYGKSWVKGGAA